MPLEVKIKRMVEGTEVLVCGITAEPDGDDDSIQLRQSSSAGLRIPFNCLDLFIEQLKKIRAELNNGNISTSTVAAVAEVSHGQES